MEENLGTVNEEEKIKLGEEEFTQAQLSEMVGLAKSVQDAERTYNTKFDRVWPEYGRSQSKIKEQEQVIADLQAKVQQVQPTPNPDDAEQMKQAVESARKLGLVTKDDFEQYLGQSFRKFYLQETGAKELLGEAKNLEEEIDGKDGRPAFKAQEILEHMVETGIRSPEKAYKDKYEAELDTWKEAQLTKARKPGLVTQKPEGGGSQRQPTAVKITKDNLEAAIRESLYGEEA